MKTIKLAQIILALTLCLVPGFVLANTGESGNSVIITESGIGDVSVVVQNGTGNDCVISQAAGYEIAVVVQGAEKTTPLTLEVKNSYTQMSVAP